jgi:AcrR family transcriptional regulator
MDEGDKHRRAPHQLPPGRHNLGRSYVEANQRQRILAAVADVTSLAGYAAMSVEDIIGTAGVSRRTFYDTFTSKEDAFLAALDGVVASLVDRVKAAHAASGSFPDGVRACLEAFLGFIADEPHLADMLLIEALAAGPAAIERRNATLKTFADMLRSAAAQLEDARHPPDLTAQAVVGGIFEVVASRVIGGESRTLPALAPHIAYFVLQPYIGDEAARREASGPVRSGRGTSQRGRGTSQPEPGNS